MRSALFLAAVALRIAVIPEASAQSTSAESNFSHITLVEGTTFGDAPRLRDEVVATFLLNEKVAADETPRPFQVGRSESSGSGFLIDESGLVVTNHHVIEGSSEIWVNFPVLGREFRAALETSDEHNDIAIILLTDFEYGDLFQDPIPFSILRSSYVRAGQNVFTVGFPLGSVLGDHPRISSGIINSTYGLENDPRIFQISVPIQPGNSGGPLFNEDG